MGEFARFKPIRHDRLIQERAHDAYKSNKKLAEPAVCPRCKAVFHEGRWQWIAAPEHAHEQVCPACHRIRDEYPAGFVTMEGSFFDEHKEEIFAIVHNTEQREKAEHPMQRIMSVEGNMVTTTDIHLARRIGEAIHHACQGKLRYHYNEEENLLRVHWER